MLGDVQLIANLSGGGRWVALGVVCDGMTSVTINRVSRDGVQVVRGAYEKDSESPFVAVDYEAPQNTVLEYVAVVSDGTMTKSSPIVTVAGVVDRGGDVLFGLTNPLAPAPVLVIRQPTLNYRGRNQIVEVIGRKDPVVVADVRLYPTGTMTVATLTESERWGLLDLLATGGLVAFSPHYPSYGYGEVWYLAIGDVIEQRVVDFATQPERYFDIPFQRVSPPPADFVGPAFATWGQVKDSGKDWQKIYTEGYVWLMLMVSGA